ncbi:hypothetical protein Agub_g1943, partial [Astrephomene gubernaculifera]
MDFPLDNPHELCPGASGRAVFVSYGSPDAIRQAKFEALQLKVRQKMLQQRTGLDDPHALKSHLDPAAELARAAKAACLGVGGCEQVQALVVPPTVTPHGEEVRGSSELILSGERREYQRPGPSRAATSNASGPVPRYRTSDLEIAKKPEGGAAGEAGARGSSGRRSSRTGGGSSGYGMSWRKQPPARDPLAAQLSEGMLTYVQCKFERPNVIGSAFVPQGQAMQEALHAYEQRKPRRPASAPLRRYMNQATGGTSRSDREAAWAVGGGGGVGTASVSASAGTLDSKWQDVPVVKVQETDLLAMYRRNSVAPPPAEPPPPAAPPPRNSSRTVFGTIRATPDPDEPAAPPTAAVVAAPGARGAAPMPTPAGMAASKGNPHRGTPAAAGAAAASTTAAAVTPTAAATAAPAVAATSDSPNSSSGDAAAKRRSTHPVTLVEPHEQDAAEEERRRRESAGPRTQAWGSGSVTAAAPGGMRRGTNTGDGGGGGAASSPTAGGVASGAVPSRPTSALSAASSRGTPTAAAFGSTAAPAPDPPRSVSSSSSSSVTPHPEPRPPAQSHAASQRRASTGGAFMSPSNPALPSGGGRITKTHSHPSTAANTANSIIATDAAGNTSQLRIPYQPVAPETRRQQQGAAVATAKTNRLRSGPARGSSPHPHGPHGPHPGSLSAEGSSLMQQQAHADRWAAPCNRMSASDDRSVLQERILDGLARLYTATGPEAANAAEQMALMKEGKAAVEVSTPGSGRGGFKIGVPTQVAMQPQPRRASRLASVESAPAEVWLGGGFGADQQQMLIGAAGGVNRRVRPPSAGCWA